MITALSLGAYAGYTCTVTESGEDGNTFTGQSEASKTEAADKLYDECMASKTIYLNYYMAKSQCYALYLTSKCKQD